jgi:restriction system protein
VLKQKPATINIKFLRQWPDYLENTGRAKSDEKTDPVPFDTETEITATPEETIANSYLKIRKNLGNEILARIKACSPGFFENLVVELLVKMGYGGTIKEAGKSIGKSGDEGIDGIIKEDRLGLDIIYVQAKRWENVVGRPEIQKFVGALAGQGAKKGVFITTSRFSNEAREYQPKNESKIVLIDGEQLADLMIDYNLAVTTTHTYEIKRIDHDYFESD